MGVESWAVATLPVVDVMIPAEFTRLRKQLGLSYEQLAVVMGKTAMTIRRWEGLDEPIDPTAALAIRKLIEDSRRKPTKKARR